MFSKKRVSHILSADHLLAVVLGSQSLKRRLDKTTTQTQNQVQSRLLLDIVVAQGAAIFELLAGEDEALLVWWDAFLVLNLGLDIVDCVGRLHLEGDSLTREGLDEAVKYWSVFYSFTSSLLFNIAKLAYVAVWNAILRLLVGLERTFAL
jgi:hypothetical protein